ncbi:MAG TPA: hypothetical protein VNA89_13800 [Gemmatimonadaceae bacterium]|nr:hypothetical protein [Gemmatimonadaceae bacterium]
MATDDGRASAFVAAVVAHLARVPGEPADPALEAEVAARARALLAAAAGGGAEGTAAAQGLAEDHAFLASVFQNADLLYAHDYAGADRVSLVIMEALGILAGRPPVD